MVKKTGKRTRHIPQRSCVGCREVLPKRSLVRIVRTPDGVVIDPTGKLNGRGVYLHQKRSCWEKGLKGAVSRALRSDISEKDLAFLNSYMQSLPEDEPMDA